MERRKFVKSTILTGLGITILPIGAIAKAGQFSAVNKTSIISENHVRHGLYNPMVGQSHDFKPWLQQFKKDVFFQNGISEGQEDMINLSFILDEQSIKIHKLKNEILVISNDRTMRQDLSSTNKIDISCSTDFYCRIVRFKKSIVIDKMKNISVLSLNNDLRVGGFDLLQNEIGFIDEEYSEEQIMIASKKNNRQQNNDAVILIIAKNK